jgi:hypothetical protein
MTIEVVTVKILYLSLEPLNASAKYGMWADSGESL